MTARYPTEVCESDPNDFSGGHICEPEEPDNFRGLQVGDEVKVTHIKSKRIIYGEVVELTDDEAYIHSMSGFQWLDFQDYSFEVV